MTPDDIGCGLWWRGRRAEEGRKEWEDESRLKLKLKVGKERKSRVFNEKRI